MKKYVKPANDVVKVSLEKLIEVIDSGEREGQYKPIGYFYAYDPDSRVWVAVDNSDGCAWTEEFSTEKKAIAWLNEY